MMVFDVQIDLIMDTSEGLEDTTKVHKRYTDITHTDTTHTDTTHTDTTPTDTTHPVHNTHSDTTHMLIMVDGGPVVPSARALDLLYLGVTIENMCRRHYRAPGHHYQYMDTKS